MTIFGSLAAAATAFAGTAGLDPKIAAIASAIGILFATLGNQTAANRATRVGRER
jgi:hypothetical protein